MGVTTDLVQHLDSDTFKPFIETMGVVLLAVLAFPGHERSEDFVSTFEKIANMMQATGFKFADMNFVDNGEVLLPYNLSTYVPFPHLMLFRGEGLLDVRHYHEPLTETDLSAYIDRFSQLPMLSTVTEDSLAGFKKTNDVVVVGYIQTHDHDTQERFSALAEALHPKFVFGISRDPELAKSEGVEFPAIAVYRPKDGEMTTFQPLGNTEENVAALRKVGRPLVIELTFNTHNDFLDMGLPFCYVFTDNHGKRIQLRKEIKPLARKHRRRLQFAIADSVDLAYIIDNMHLNATILPAFAILEPVKNLKYPMNGPSNESFVHSIDRFAQDFLEAKLQPTIKSEPLPPNNSGSLVKIVGLNYRDVVVDTSKDVLVTYCISPCGPCKAFQPILEALAEMYTSDARLKEQVIIGKVMYDANDTPERKIVGFPTVKLFPAAAKDDPEEFLDILDFDRLADFIRDKGTFHAGAGPDQLLTQRSDHRNGYHS